MSLPIILIVIVSIVGTFSFFLIWIAKQKGFSTKQTVDPMPTQSTQKAEDN
ncbi:hypothetical protein [Lysinibacillus sp. LZ02]|uniref:hypothetical protein n=1 Tax=Lysinibacillus sp. LZ02 TaxID=3420668 RepID=UPI003D36C502